MGYLHFVYLAGTTATEDLVEDSGENAANTGGGHLAPCEFGLLDCGPNEKCMASSVSGGRARSGVCRCDDGFQRNPVTLSCESSHHSLGRRQTLYTCVISPPPHVHCKKFICIKLHYF